MAPPNSELSSSHHALNSETSFCPRLLTNPCAGRRSRIKPLGGPQATHLTTRPMTGARRRRIGQSPSWFSHGVFTARKRGRGHLFYRWRSCYFFLLIFGVFLSASVGSVELVAERFLSRPKYNVVGPREMETRPRESIFWLSW